MLRISLLALLAVSAGAFSPSAMPPSSLKLRSASGATRLSMAERSEPSVFSKAALAVLVAGSLFAPMLPVEASINSQMSMNTDSFSVLRDNQKTYAQKGRTVNPYASQEEQLQQLEKIARLEECERKSTPSACEEEETKRQNANDRAQVEQRRSPLTFAIPVVVTTALSGVLIKILNR